MTSRWSLRPSLLAPLLWDRLLIPDGWLVDPPVCPGQEGLHHGPTFT